MYIEHGAGCRKQGKVYQLSVSSCMFYIFPVIFGPFFAHVAIEKGLEFGLVLAIIYSLVLTILDNIQEDLEDPFDGVGSDDIRLNFPTMLNPNMVED